MLRSKKSIYKDPERGKGKLEKCSGVGGLADCISCVSLHSILFQSDGPLRDFNKEDGHGNYLDPAIFTALGHTLC